ncbi:MAG TPA: AMP-binding protein, partial [Tepidisphaeraceae bacterium]|nr:AMP-binding protein [Tepidisphaeraceae bacterium]
MMPECEVANFQAAAAGPSSAAEVQNRFVQLPTDAQRSAAVGHRRAVNQPRPIRRAADPAGALVGALCAMLFRYTQQETIDIELFASQPSFTGRGSALISCPVSADGRLGDLVARAAAGIAAAVGGASSTVQSNIAVSIFAAGDTPEQVLEASDAHDVHVILRVEPGTIEIAYNARLFEPGTIDRLADAVVRVFEVALDRPATPIGELPVLSAEDLHTIAVEWDSGQAGYRQEPVHRAFERLAGKQPDAPAVSFENRSLTYGELDAKSNRLAHHLVAAGVAPGSAVAVCVQPSLDIVVAFLAIWKAGAVYVPLDPTHPPALIAAILEEVRPKIVLTQSALIALTDPVRHAQYCFDLDAPRLSSQPTTAPAVQVSLDDRAYVLYTSGTTGKPKGVDARHGNLAHYIHVAQQKYGFGRDDVFCSLARYTFSISLFELVSPLCCGGGR